MSAALESLDTLIDDFRHALSLDDLETVDRVNASVEPVVEAAVAAARAGEVDRGALQERLETLQQLTAQATQGAEHIRNEAARELRGANQNRNAAQAYANVRGRGGRS